MRSCALITGSAKRIGKEIALTLAKNGYDIALHYNNSKDSAIKTQNEIEKLGVNCKLFKCDLSNTKQSSKLIETVVKELANLDTLINSASIFERASLLDSSNNLIDNTFNINLVSPLILMRDFAKNVKKGNILNILDGKISNNNYSHFVYSLTKKGLLDLTYLSANEFAPNIRVNGIAPGLILPPDGDDYSYMDKLSQKIPLKSVGNTQDIVDGVLFLLKSSYITGEVIFIDGGLHLK